MDIRDILKSFDQLTEGESTVHKAGPGGYGNRHGSEDVTDQYGKPIGRASLSKMSDAPAVKRGKGRPPKNADASGEVKSYDSTALSKAMGMGKAPKPTGKPSVKHSLKEYFDQMDESMLNQLRDRGNVVTGQKQQDRKNFDPNTGAALKPNSTISGIRARMQNKPSQSVEEAGLAVQPMPTTPQQKQQQAVASKPSFMIKDPANPSTPAITTSDPAVVNAAKNGTMTMQKPGAAPTSGGGTPSAGSGSQVGAMAEEGGNWIKGAIKHPGAFTKKASAHGMTPSQFRDKVLSHKEDYPAKTEKQAQLAKTLSKMHESQGESPYTLELISSEEQDDPEGWSTMNVSTFKVLKNGKEIGTAEYDDYFGNLDIDINGKRQQLKYDSNHPLLKMAKHAVEEPINIAQHGVKEAEAPQHFAQSSPISTGGRNPNSLEEGKKGVNPFAKKDDKTAKKDDKAEKIGKKVTKDIEKDEKKGAAPKKGVNPFAKKEVKEAAKPDFLDMDKDGDKKEPMKKAVKDKKKVKEGMEHHLQAARLEGKSHALRKMPYNCTHDDMEEARCYHDGFKEGLDECYGQMPIMGRTAVGEMGSGPEVATMASYGADDMGMDEGNAFTAGLARTPQGGKFKVGGNTFTDKTSYDSHLDEFAFEALDKQLNAILEGKEVSEGMTVSISKGQQGSPDSVSVSAQDGEADQLLSIIKSAGMGLFGGEEQGFNAPQGTAGAHGGISVVDDHDGMMALMKKLTGGDMPSNGDFADEEGSEEEHMHGEEGHSHEGEEDSCNECGMAYESCGCDHGDKEVVDEVESEDQMAYNVAEDNPPDNGSANSTNATQGNDAANTALAIADKKGPIAEEDNEHDDKEEHECEKCHSDPCKCDEEDSEEEEVEESIYESYANSADDTFEADIDFMTKVISGGLNKQKSTGQTTIPVVASQKSRMGVDGLGSPMKESTDLLKDYMKLSGL